MQSKFKPGDMVRITKTYPIEALYHTFGDPLPLAVVRIGYRQYVEFELEDLELVSPPTSPKFDNGDVLKAYWSAKDRGDEKETARLLRAIRKTRPYYDMDD